VVAYTLFEERSGQVKPRWIVAASFIFSVLCFLSAVVMLAMDSLVYLRRELVGAALWSFVSGICVAIIALFIGVALAGYQAAVNLRRHNSN
jgi:hypothetical protein